MSSSPTPGDVPSSPNSRHPDELRARATTDLASTVDLVSSPVKLARPDGSTSPSVPLSPIAVFHRAGPKLGSEGVDEDVSMGEITTSTSAEAKATFRSRPSACIFVASLATHKTDDHLSLSVEEHFSQWGRILSTKVLRDSLNRPYAFVQYETNEEAERAICHGTHSILHGRSLRCETAKVNRTVFLAPTNPAQPLNLDSVTKVAEAFGEIEDIVCDDHQLTWFVQYVYREDAIRAYASLRMEGAFEVQWVQNLAVDEKKTRADQCTIYVGRLDPDTTEEQLCDKFALFGVIEKCHIVRRNHTNGDFAFIQYQDEKSVADAVEHTNHTMFRGRTIHVQFREDRAVLKPQLAPPPLSNVSAALKGLSMSPLGSEGMGRISRVRRLPNSRGASVLHPSINRMPDMAKRSMPSRVTAASRVTAVPYSSFADVHQKKGKVSTFQGRNFVPKGTVNAEDPNADYYPVYYYHPHWSMYNANGYYYGY